MFNTKMQRLKRNDVGGGHNEKNTKNNQRQKNNGHSKTRQSWPIDQKPCQARGTEREQRSGAKRVQASAPGCRERSSFSNNVRGEARRIESAEHRTKTESRRRLQHAR